YADHLHDVTLQDAGYGFKDSWTKLAQWFLTGKAPKLIRAICATDSGQSTRKAFSKDKERNGLDVDSLNQAIAKMGKANELKAEVAKGEDKEHTRGMKLESTIVVKGDGDRKIEIFSDTNSHFGARNDSIGALMKDGPGGELTSNSKTK